MSKFVFYDNTTGIIDFVKEADSPDAILRLNPRLGAIIFDEKITAFHSVDITSNPHTVIYTAPNPTDDEKWNWVRRQRNAKLLRNDWTQGPDSPLSESKRAEWAAYRQALRDITNQSDPDNITWPTIPQG